MEEIELCISSVLSYEILVFFFNRLERGSNLWTFFFHLPIFLFFPLFFHTKAVYQCGLVFKSHTLA